MAYSISIRGRTYSFRSDEPEEEVRAVARWLEGRMAPLAARIPDEYTAALLTALNVASEYGRYRRDVAARVELLEREVATIRALLASPAASLELGEE